MPGLTISLDSLPDAGGTVEGINTKQIDVAAIYHNFHSATEFLKEKKIRVIDLSAYPYSPQMVDWVKNIDWPITHLGLPFLPPPEDVPDTLESLTLHIPSDKNLPPLLKRFSDLQAFEIYTPHLSKESCAALPPSLHTLKLFTETAPLDFTPFPHLKSLALYKAQPPPVELERLELIDCPLPETPPPSLYVLKTALMTDTYLSSPSSLTHLSIPQAPLTDAGLAAVAQNCPHLSYLNISHCTEITDFSPLAPLPLVQLQIEQCKITEQTLKTISTIGSLLSLNLTACRLRGPWLEPLKGLHELTLSINSRLTDTSIIPLMENCRHLQRLDLSGTAITDETVVALSERCPQLLYLALDRCFNLTDAAIIPLAENNLVLQQLNLCFCTNITNKSLISLATHCPHLQRLNLWGCIHVTNRGVIALAEKCTQLQKLNLRRCDKVTDLSIISLAKNCKELKELNLNKCKKISPNAPFDSFPLLERLDVNGCKKPSEKMQETLTQKLQQLNVDEVFLSSIAEVKIY